MDQLPKIRKQLLAGQWGGHPKTGHGVPDLTVAQTGTAAWTAGGIVNGLGSPMSPLLLLIVLAVLS